MEVQAFYERYPYPPPVDDLEAYRRRWQDPRRRRADFHLFWPRKPYREDYSVLVAGCGTAQAAKHAMRWPKAQITGIDFSATSIQHTTQLKERHKLQNLELHQLPLERVAELGKTFDQIICTGVLHHLAEPAAGLSALRAVLKPEGALHLMVYARYGRSGIYMLQEFFRRVGVRAGTGDMREIAVALEALPSAHPLAQLLRHAADFRTEAAIADALLNPRDQAYSVPELFQLLRSGRWTFGRWLRQAPYSLQAGLMSRLPHSMRAAPVTSEDQYAAAEAFRGTITSHSVVAYRDDYPGSAAISFDSDEWLRYIPIRTADTLCLEERLPPGVAAILINRAHAHSDICLPLSTAERQLVEAIDGRRSVRGLLGSSAERTAARSLFERLWSHDQVVFDASGAL